MDTNERIERLEREIWRDRGRSMMCERATNALIALVRLQYPEAAELLVHVPELSEIPEIPEDLRSAFVSGMHDASQALKLAAIDD